MTRSSNATRHCLVVALFLFGTSMARGVGWRAVFPEGGNTPLVATDSADPQVVYALRGGTNAGIFRSTDGGLTWVARETGLSGVGSALAVTGPGMLEVGSDVGIARSADRGETWTTHNQGLPSLQIRSLAAAVDAGLIFASTPNGIFKASNDGGPWVFSGPPSAAPGSLYALGVSRSGTAIYASAVSAAYRSIDGGVSWTSFPAPSFSSFTVDPNSSAVVYAASGNSLFKSVNAGTSWSPVFQPGGAISFNALAIDPLNPQIIYAGSGGFGNPPTEFQSVFRSGDAGNTWSLFDIGLPNVYVMSLAFSADGIHLFAGTSNQFFNFGAGVYLYDPAGPSGPCLPTAARLCLLGGRFGATLTAVDPRTGASATGHALSQTDRFGMFSLPEFTGDSSFPEILIKMADATGAPPPFGGSFWVFYSSLTDTQYILTVTDLNTQVVRTYGPSQTGLLCGGADTSAFQN